MIGQPLGNECFERVLALVLAARQRHGRLSGQHLGIDSSVIEDKASLRPLSERNTEEGYGTYMQRLAREAGLGTPDGAELRNFDRHRVGKRMSYELWQNPHDPAAKIGRPKEGATDLVYLPAHTVDLGTGAIIQAQELAGDQRDSAELSERVLLLRRHYGVGRPSSGWLWVPIFWRWRGLLLRSALRSLRTSPSSFLSQMIRAARSILAKTANRRSSTAC